MKHCKRDRRMLGWRVLGFGAALLLGGCYTGASEPALDATPEQPRSLRGVDVDGTLRASPSGEFVFDTDARALFDHFLAAEGEIDETALHAHVRMAIDRRLSGLAAEQAWEAFLSYLDYRSEASTLLSGDGPREPSQQVRALAEIRARTIGDAPGVPDEGPRLAAAMQLWTLQTAIQAGPEQQTQMRAQRIAEIQAGLGDTPDPNARSRILERIHAALAPIAMDDMVARRSVLAELVGASAAERWLVLERRRAEDLARQG